MEKPSRHTTSFQRRYDVVCLLGSTLKENTSSHKKYEYIHLGNLHIKSTPYKRFLH